MQHELRRKDRQLTTEEALKLLETAEYGVLSTVNTDGTPYGVPLNFVLDNNKIYFHCAGVGQKLDNIAHNNNVTFVVIGETEPVADVSSYSTYFESAIVSGKASIVTDAQAKRNILYVLTEKYLPENMDIFEKSLSGGMLEKTTVVAIDIEHLVGKAKKKK